MRDDSRGRLIARSLGAPCAIPAGTTTPPLVNLTSDQTASALVEGVDASEEDEKTCPSCPALLVTPPGVEHSFRVQVKFNGFADLEVHPVVPGATGTLANRS